MEQQRPLRLGDLVDDYCPRERRITNHAIVAIVEDAIRQTRCTACESDHVYKGGKAPQRRKPKDEQAVLYDQVLANATAGTAVAAAPEPPVVAAVAAPPVVAPQPPPVAAPVAPAAPVAATPEPSAAPEPVLDEGWSLNRRLIRASLPRIDGQSPIPRSIPEFTMHQRNVRGSQYFRSGGSNGFNGSANGNPGNSWQDRSGNNGNSNGHRESQPGLPNGQRPGGGGGGGRRRRRHKAPRPQN
jgi:hypothetical protein